MAIRKEDIVNMVESLSNEDKKAAFDFIQFLAERSQKKPVYWKNIEQQEPDDKPLTKQEIEQLECKEGYISGEDANREYGLQVDLP